MHKLHCIPFHYITLQTDRHTDIHTSYVSDDSLHLNPPPIPFQEQRISDPRDPRGRSNGPHGVPVVQGRPVPTEDHLGGLGTVFPWFSMVFPWNQRGVLWIFPKKASRWEFWKRWFVGTIFCLGDICFLEVVEEIFCTGIPPVWR